MQRHDARTRQQVWDLLESAGIGESQILGVIEAGSTAHAISVGSDDLDFTVVWMESLDQLVIGRPGLQSMMLRTKPDGVRSEPGDIDLQVYTLRRFMSLAATGNPSVLMILFAPPEYWMVNGGLRTDQIAGLVRSKRAAATYNGYLEQQLGRWRGERGQKNVNRSELVEAHGFDTKYAAHALRLGIQGIEYLSTGRLTLPMPEEDAARIRAVRSGEVSEDDALAWAYQLKDELGAAAAASTLPENPDQKAINNFLVAVYRERLSSGFSSI
jgi:hypothetical protein